MSQLFALAFYRQEYDGTGETLTRETTVESDGSGDCLSLVGVSAAGEAG